MTVCYCGTYYLKNIRIILCITSEIWVKSETFGPYSASHPRLGSSRKCSKRIRHHIPSRKYSNHIRHHIPDLDQVGNFRIIFDITSQTWVKSEMFEPYPASHPKSEIFEPYSASHPRPGSSWRHSNHIRHHIPGLDQFSIRFKKK